MILKGHKTLCFWPDIIQCSAGSIFHIQARCLVRSSLSTVFLNFAILPKVHHLLGNIKGEYKEVSGVACWTYLVIAFPNLALSIYGTPCSIYCQHSCAELSHPEYTRLQEDGGRGTIVRAISVPWKSLHALFCWTHTARRNSVWR